MKYKTKVFNFEDYNNHSYDPLVNHIEKVDINKEIANLEKYKREIVNIQHQIIHNYEEYYEIWDKNIYTVVARRYYK